MSSADLCWTQCRSDPEETQRRRETSHHRGNSRQANTWNQRRRLFTCSSDLLCCWLDDHWIISRSHNRLNQVWEEQFISSVQGFDVALIQNNDQSSWIDSDQLLFFQNKSVWIDSDQLLFAVKSVLYRKGWWKHCDTETSTWSLVAGKKLFFGWDFKFCDSWINLSRSDFVSTLYCKGSFVLI